ncbi:unnamed protein product [Cylindrotheca closterium]|uniref:Uncharacterized protein n=1 Tax=Cylindrotheca closterium TaxID=2856 RepID=A0AAD2CP09_9STRA|nr:unnamed protein product [Cylindrotheca closterium]
MTNDSEQYDSFFSELPEMLGRDSMLSEGEETEIDEFILTEMCKEVAAMFGGTDYDSQHFDDYDDYADKDRGSSSNEPIKSSAAMIEIVRKSLAGVQIDGIPAIDRFSMSLENPDEQRKLLEYFQKAKQNRDKEARIKAEQQEAERIKRQEQDRKEREEREAKLKKEKEAKERQERHERERRERREKRKREEKERKERKEREAREKAELEAREEAEREAKERAEAIKAKAEREARAQAEAIVRAEREQRERERRVRVEKEQQREMQSVEGEHTDMIEVAPGLTLPLLSKDATLRALAKDDTITTTCFACQQTLTAPGHVEFIVCCDDWICMAVDDDGYGDANKPRTGNKRCIGFGLKDGDVAKWVFSRKSIVAN